MGKRNKINIFTTALCAVVLCALISCMFMASLYLSDFATEKLEELNPQKTGDMKNALWLIEKILFILPVCVLLLFQMVVYNVISKKKKSIKHRQRAWELIIAFVFTYAVLLPVVITYSENNPPLPDAKTGKETLSIIARSAQWFMWQILIFMPAILYHKVMAENCAIEEKATENEEIDVENTSN